jgi:transposase-like protein
MKQNKQEQSALYERMEDHLRMKKPLLGKDSPFSELLQTMVDKILEGEVDNFLEEEKQSGNTNKRNGYTRKKVLTSTGSIDISTPRDRNGAFEPELIGKRERELSSGLDEQILALYAQGNSVEDVRRLLHKIYGVEISAGKISQITDSILPEIESWRTRPLERFYPIVYLDAIHFKVKHEGAYGSRAFYTAYGVTWEGNRDLLGLYINESEGAKRWGIVLEDIKKRGVEDILVICTDNLKGFSEVVQDVFNDAIVQKCIVHQVRNSLKFVDEKDLKKVASSLRKIYTSATIEQADTALQIFENEWGKQYKYIAEKWKSNWEELTAFMDFSPPIRKMIYTTNPVEALHRIMRKTIKSKAAWVSETALIKQIYLTLKYNEKSWKRSAHGWKAIQRDLLELYPERIKA